MCCIVLAHELIQDAAVVTKKIIRQDKITQGNRNHITITGETKYLAAHDTLDI